MEYCFTVAVKKQEGNLSGIEPGIEEALFECQVAPGS